MKKLICDGCHTEFELKEKSNQETLKAKGMKVFCCRKCRDRTIAPAINERAKKNYYARKAKKIKKAELLKRQNRIIHTVFASTHKQQEPL